MSNPVEQLELWWEQSRKDHQLAIEAARTAVEAAVHHPREVSKVGEMLEQLHLKLEQTRSQFVLLPETLELRTEALSVLETQIRQTRQFLEECRATPWLRGVAWQMIEAIPERTGDEAARVLLEEFIKPGKIAALFAVGDAARLTPLAGWVRAGGVTVSKPDLFESKLLLERGKGDKYLAKPKVELQETGLSVPENVSDYDAAWLSDDLVRAWEQLPSRELRRSLRFLVERVDYLFLDAKAKWLPLLEADWKVSLHGNLAAARRATLGNIFQVAEIRVVDPISEPDTQHSWRISPDARLYVPSMKYYFGDSRLLLLELHREPLQTFSLQSPELENWSKIGAVEAPGIPKLKWNGLVGKASAWLLEMDGTGACPFRIPATPGEAARVLLRIARMSEALERHGLFLNYFHPDAFILDAEDNPWLVRIPRLDTEQHVDTLDSLPHMLATQPPRQWPPASALSLEETDFPESLRELRARIIGTNDLSELINQMEALA